MKKKLLLVCETLDGALKTPVPELAGFAKACGVSPGDSAIIIAGRQISAQAGIAAACGIDVIAMENDAFRYHNPPALARAVIEICRELGASRVCFPGTMQSCSSAVIVSVSLGCSPVTSVEKIAVNNGSLECTRSVYNGKIQERISIGPHDNFVCTIQTGSFAGITVEATSPGKVISYAFEAGGDGFSPQGISGAVDSAVSLNEADVIIAAGRGIGKEENLGVIYETAKVFQSSAVGASRIVCDNGWIPYGQQVGMTGKTVSPRLYIACGISGSQQHIVGMKNSQLIVAINSDPHANIFSTAHIGIVDDLNLFLPVFIEKCRDISG